MQRIKFYLLLGLMAALILTNSCQTENKTASQNFISGNTKLLVCPVHILDNQVS